MFYGSYKNTLDAKGRLIVPKQFREQLGAEFMITRGLDGCLFAYPMDEWSVFEEKLSKLPLTNKDARKVVRFFAAGATLCEMDKQGRVLIPENLRGFAGMQKDVVVEGSMKRVELWAREKYMDATSADEIDLPAVGSGRQEESEAWGGLRKPVPDCGTQPGRRRF